jgi:hypothetical protein
VIEAELATDLVHEVVDLVPDAASSVAAQVRQIFADLRGVHAREVGEPVGRHVRHPRLGLIGQDLEIHRQPGDGGFRDPAT